VAEQGCTAQADGQADEQLQGEFQHARQTRCLEPRRAGEAASGDGAASPPRRGHAGACSGAPRWPQTSPCPLLALRSWRF
jgi:hypothetical protein